MSHSSPASAAESAAPQATSLYVYAVIPAAEATGLPAVTGIDGPSATVRTVEAGELAALVSALAPDRTPGRRDDLEAHRRVQSIATEHATTIPMRFGMVIDGEGAVREKLLIRHGPELSELLRRLRGHVQMTVRAFYAEDALLRAVTGDNADIASRTAAIQGLSEVESRPERIALGEMVAAAIEARRESDARALKAHLAPLATDARFDPPASDRVALNAHLLVPRERRPALDEAIHRLGNALQGYLALRYIGPLPPYSFSELSLDADED